jgi:hypothetical protein
MRTIAILVAGIIISVAFLTSTDTYSWFTSSASGGARVTAATTKDILDLFELVYLNNNIREENPIALRIRKAPGLGYDPIIFFSIEDDIGDYMININPIKLVSSGTYIIPLEISCSMGQFSNFSEWPDSITGSLRI